MSEIAIANSKRNKFFLAVNTGYVENETPTQKYIDFHAERSGNGLYCTIAGNVLTPNGHGTNNVCARISSSTEWKTVTKEINASGAKAGIQLSSTWPTYTGIKKFITSNISKATGNYKSTGKCFSDSEILKFYDDLTNASNLCIEAGFQHIQLHAAHGYLFNLLLDPIFSANSELCTEKTRQWLEYLKTQGIETSIRISMNTGLDSVESDEIRLKDLIELPCDYIDLSYGLYNLDKKMIYPSTDQLIQSRWTANIETGKKFPHKKFIASGRLGSIVNNPLDLSENMHLGVCRDLIANPDFFKNQQNGCANKMKCHYFSRGTGSLECGKWNN